MNLQNSLFGIQDKLLLNVRNRLSLVEAIGRCVDRYGGAEEVEKKRDNIIHVLLCQDLARNRQMAIPVGTLEACYGVSSQSHV